MNDLMKSLKCGAEPIAICEEHENCVGCPYRQPTYGTLRNTMEVAYDRITKLEKSNRNWRRKYQRAKKKYKELINASKANSE